MTSGLPSVDSLHDLAALLADRPDVFIRYSKGPDADAADPKSRDYEADVELPGLSVTTLNPEPWWPRPAIDWVARRVCKYAELATEDERRPWLLTGRQVGVGPDHEPLVVDVRPLAWIGPRALEEALTHYRRLFDVGQDSRGRGG
jgi:hypothetical protein